jgi:hypothetical protein
MRACLLLLLRRLPWDSALVDPWLIHIPLLSIPTRRVGFGRSRLTILIARSHPSIIFQHSVTHARLVLFGVRQALLYLFLPCPTAISHTRSLSTVFSDTLWVDPQFAPALGIPCRPTRAR